MNTRRSGSPSCRGPTQPPRPTDRIAPNDGREWPLTNSVTPVGPGSREPKTNLGGNNGYKESSAAWRRPQVEGAQGFGRYSDLAARDDRGRSIPGMEAGEVRRPDG